MLIHNYLNDIAVGKTQHLVGKTQLTVGKTQLTVEKSQHLVEKSQLGRKNPTSGRKNPTLHFLNLNNCGKNCEYQNNSLPLPTLQTYYSPLCMTRTTVSQCIFIPYNV